MNSSVETYPHRQHWQRWFLFITAPIALALGTWGFWVYQGENGEHRGFLSALYQAAQLFILHTPHLPGKINLPLELGRWLAAACFGLAALLALHRIFRSEFSRFLLTFRRGHVVICGLGELGLRLALEYRQSGDGVVAIEADASSPSVETAQYHGVTVLIGDARNRAILREAHLAHASRLIAVCSDDATNIGIASAAGEFVEGASSRDSPLECWLFLADGNLRDTLRNRDVFPHTGPRYRVNVRGLDLPELHARLLFARCPLDYQPILETSELRVHLVIAGFGQMGQSVALQAARIGHFANDRPVRLTIVERDAARLLAAFKIRYPGISKACDIDEPAEAPEDERALAECLAGLKGGSADLTYYVICSETEDASLRAREESNLAVGLLLGEKLDGTGTPIHVFLSSASGSASLLKSEPARRPLCCGLHAFGMMEDACSLSIVLREEQDELARALHEAWLEDEKKRPDFGSKPSHKPWDELSDQFKESNWQAADHAPIKLRALGYHAGAPDPEANRTPITSFNEEQVKLLSKMEHARWCAERWIGNWTTGSPRDDTKRVHPDLVRWVDLPNKEKHIDLNLATRSLSG